MQLLAGLLLLSAALPLGRALARSRGSTLCYPLLWAWAAWLAWLVVVGGGAFWPWCAAPLHCYLALCLTGCAGVAVLGARRPGAAAWNFVVLGLLAVLLLPVAEGFGTPRLNAIYLSFLGATLAAALLNYVPTALAPAAVSLAVACGVQLAGLATGGNPDWLTLSAGCLIGLTPWLGWAALGRRGRAATEFDRTWLAFRDHYGVVWGQRTREQFNRAAANAGWPVTLTWHGLQPAAAGKPPEPALPLETLQALLKRFDDRGAVGPEA
jgi:hypothetical protein